MKFLGGLVLWIMSRYPLQSEREVAIPSISLPWRRCTTLGTPLWFLEGNVYPIWVCYFGPSTEIWIKASFNQINRGFYSKSRLRRKLLFHLGLMIQNIIILKYLLHIECCRKLLSSTNMKIRGNIPLGFWSTSISSSADNYFLYEKQLWLAPGPW